ncbi:subtilisin family serine protease [Hamadaea flava]|uniref:S8 family serine peptidase n=1 Tax=Hamadaea flava TaxID=1742688 RepID=A0ABV8LM37_9ACTN|nr:S8 family peptidase [Hamadaea flava]MCP2329625.1 subtilisin family serine protease [Hamadaea flava]
MTFTRLLPRLAVTAAFALVAAMTATGQPAQAGPVGQILYAGDSTAIPGSYIVVLKDDVSTSSLTATASGLANRYGGSINRTYKHAVHGFSAKMSATAAAQLAANPDVAYVEQDRTISLAGTQAPTPSWGLDRIDQRALPLDNSYTYANNGAGVKAYIIDTGINFTHSDFGGRAISGADTVDNDNDASDCHGHGSHVAGTVGGTSYGVAKGVTLVGVRVIGCTGSGTYSGVIAGVDWVAADHAAGARAVANMSLAGPYDAGLNTAVARAISDGVVFAVAAANSNADACSFTPAMVPEAITVGATTDTDTRASYSDYGYCVDIFAPGSGITSAWIGSDTATKTANGTSMATPHVTGAAALVLAANPGFTPQQVRDKLVVNTATYGVVTDPGPGSPNRLLNVSNVAPPSQDFAMAVTPGSGNTGIGGSLTATVSTTTTVGSAEPVTFAVAGGLPAGATATFSPATVTSGGSSTMTITTSASTAPGTYPVTLKGAGTYHAQNATFTLTVNAAPGCSQTNGTDVPILEGTKQPQESPITISGCAGSVGMSTVEVHIKHTYISDLIVTLVSPNKTSYILHNRAGVSAVNIDKVYTLNLSGQTANGTWKLTARDAAKTGDAGYIDSWTLNLGT